MQNGHTAWGDYELRQAVLGTIGALAVLGINILTYMYIIDPNVDPMLILRTFMLRLQPVLACSVLILWISLFVNWITPVDYFRKIGESPIACAAVLMGYSYAVLQLWLYG